MKNEYGLIGVIMTVMIFLIKLILVPIIALVFCGAVIVGETRMPICALCSETHSNGVK